MSVVRLLLEDCGCAFLRIFGRKAEKRMFVISFENMRITALTLFLPLSKLAFAVRYVFLHSQRFALHSRPYRRVDFSALEYDWSYHYNDRYE